MSRFSFGVALPIVRLISGAWVCDEAMLWTDKNLTVEPEPECGGVARESCNDGRCCDPIFKTCSAIYSSKGRQASKDLCLQGGAKMLFDIWTKGSGKVPDPQEDAKVEAMCCTPFAQATCLHWESSHYCPSGQQNSRTPAAPPDQADGMTLSQGKFEELCCKNASKMCFQFETTDPCDATEMFDVYNKWDTVPDPAGDSQVKQACCLPYVDAVCSSWTSKSCPSGKRVTDSSKAAPPDNGTMLDTFEETCCHVSCSDVPLAFCATNDATTFFAAFDNAGLVAVPDPAGDTQKAATCCKAYTAATCYDWLRRPETSERMRCNDTESRVKPEQYYTPAPADSGSGKMLSQEKFDKLCCTSEPKFKCQDWTPTTTKEPVGDAGGSTPQASAALGVLSAIVWMAVS